MVITPNMVIYNGFWPIHICYIYYIYSHNWYIWWPTPNILFGMIFLVILFTNQQWLGAFLLTIGPDEDPIQNMEQLWLRIHNQKTWDVASKPIYARMIFWWSFGWWFGSANGKHTHHHTRDALGFSDKHNMHTIIYVEWSGNIFCFLSSMNQ